MHIHIWNVDAVKMKEYEWQWALVEIVLVCLATRWLFGPKFSLKLNKILIVSSFLLYPGDWMLV